MAWLASTSHAQVTRPIAGDATDVPLKDAEAQGLKLQEALKARSLADLGNISSDKIVAAAQQAGVTGSSANDIGTTPPIRTATTVPE